jgi:hypothetical protein
VAVEEVVEAVEAAPAHQGVALLLHQEVAIAVIVPLAGLQAPPVVLHTVIHLADLTHQLHTCLTTVQLTITIVTLTTV